MSPKSQAADCIDLHVRSVDDALLDIAFERLRLSVLMSIAVCLIFVGLLARYFPCLLYTSDAADE